MSVFNQSKTFSYYPDSLDKVTEYFCNYFDDLGYQTTWTQMLSGGYDISIKNSNTFKAVLGMQTALKIKIQPQQTDILVEASVGIWGQQLIPSIISMFFFWPVIITQIWGLRKSSKLDDETMLVMEKALKQFCRPVEEKTDKMIFCTTCGSAFPEGTKYCSNDGTKLT